MHVSRSLLPLVARSVAALLLGWAAVSAHALELKDLMAWLAQTREGTATFSEERHVNGFDAPLRTSGELYFKAPDVFERRTLSPVRESMRVDGSQMTLARGNQRRSMSLASAPEAAAIVGAIRGTLTGDAKTLDLHFKVGLSGRDEKWLLDLVPRDAQLQSTVRNVQLHGSKGLVTGMDIWFASGDHAKMSIKAEPR